MSFHEDDLTLGLIAERLNSLTVLMELRFTNLDGQLEGIKDAPVRFSKLESRVDAVEKDVAAMHGEKKDNLEWKRGSLIFALIAICALVVSIGQLATSIH